MSIDRIGVRTLEVSNANRHVGLALLLQDNIFTTGMPCDGGVLRHLVAVMMMIAPKIFKQRMRLRGQPRRSESCDLGRQQSFDSGGEAPPALRMTLQDEIFYGSAEAAPLPAVDNSSSSLVGDGERLALRHLFLRNRDGDDGQHVGLHLVHC